MDDDQDQNEEDQDQNEDQDQDGAQQDQGVSDTDSGEAREAVVVRQPPLVKRRSRSYTEIPTELKLLCLSAKRWVADHTLFTNPFLNALGMLNLEREGWEHAQDEHESYGKITNQCRGLVTDPVIDTQFVR